MEHSAVTACILSNNNEATITEAINSVLPWVDECIVLDSGSSDQTTLLASSLGASIHFKPWEEDFSALRNHALGLVRTPWVLMLDTDERFYWNSSVMNFKQWLGQLGAEQMVYAIPCLNQDMHTKENLGKTYVERLFQPAFYSYKGRIHESLEHKDGKDKNIQILDEASIVHLGYSHHLMKQKSERNLKILFHELEISSSDGRLLRYIANELYNQEQYTKAAGYAEEAVHLLHNSNTYIRASAFYYWFMSLFKEKQYSEAAHAAKLALQQYPGYPDPPAFLLEYSFLVQNWEDVLYFTQLWQNALEARELYPYYFEPYTDSLLLRAADASLSLGERETAIEILFTVYARNIERTEALFRLNSLIPDKEYLDTVLKRSDHVE